MFSLVRAELSVVDSLRSGSHWAWTAAGRMKKRVRRKKAGKACLGLSAPDGGLRDGRRGSFITNSFPDSIKEAYHTGGKISRNISRGRACPLGPPPV
jgi:hypothetical protein